MWCIKRLLTQIHADINWKKKVCPPKSFILQTQIYIRYLAVVIDFRIICISTSRERFSLPPAGIRKTSLNPAVIWTISQSERALENSLQTLNLNLAILRCAILPQSLGRCPFCSFPNERCQEHTFSHRVEVCSPLQRSLGHSHEPPPI